MYQQVQEVLSNWDALNSELIISRWLGAFTRLDVLIAVRAYDNDGIFSSFEVDGDGRQIATNVESYLIAYPHLKDVRIVAYDDCKWYVHPSPEEIKPHWKVWVYGRTPILSVQWDPGEYFWMDPYSGKEETFFQY